RCEFQVLEIFDSLSQSGRENKIAIPGQAPHEQLEGRAVTGLAGLEVARRHGELIEIGVESSAKLGNVTLRYGHYFFFPSFVAGGGASLTSNAASRSAVTAFASN